jgi:hypothetical protein
MKHLTDEQLAEWLAGDSAEGGCAEETRRHLESCAQCHQEAMTLRDGVLRYSLAVKRQAARSQEARLAGGFAPKRALAMHRLRWAGAGALALLLTAQTAWMLKPHNAPAAPPATVSAGTKTAPVAAMGGAMNNAPDHTMSDDELLEAVNNDLSRDVPEALAPVSAITVARNKIAAASKVAANNSSAK